MRKPGLFLRIFIWFWVCMTLVAAGNILVLILNRPQAFMDEHRDRSVRLLRLLTEGEAQTQSPSSNWMKKVEDDLHMEIYLYDREGRPIGESTTSPEARQ